MWRRFAPTNYMEKYPMMCRMEEMDIFLNNKQKINSLTKNTFFKKNSTQHVEYDFSAKFSECLMQVGIKILNVKKSGHSTCLVMIHLTNSTCYTLTKNTLFSKTNITQHDIY